MQEIVEKTPKPKTLAKRVEALEAEIAALKETMQSPAGQPDPHWWKRSFGRFKDDPGFEEVVRLGRAWRKRQPKC